MVKLSLLKTEVKVVLVRKAIRETNEKREIRAIKEMRLPMPTSQLNSLLRLKVKKVIPEHRGLREIRVIPAPQARRAKPGHRGRKARKGKRELTALPVKMAQTVSRAKTVQMVIHQRRM